MTEPSRLQMLAQFLEQNPGDAFARYGLAMEYSKAGQTEQALAEFKRLLELHPDYTNGYFMAAQTLERNGRTAEAKKMLESGVEAAKRTGNKHALSEMSGMLEELSYFSEIPSRARIAIVNKSSPKRRMFGGLKLFAYIRNSGHKSDKMLLRWLAATTLVNQAMAKTAVAPHPPTRNCCAEFLRLIHEQTVILLTHTPPPSQTETTR